MADDLQELLDKLVEVGPDTTYSGITSVDGDVELSELTGLFEDEPKSDDEQYNESITTSIIKPVIISEPDQDLTPTQKYLEKLDGVTEEVLSACRSDRQEAQDLIQTLRAEMDTMLARSQPLSKTLVDGIVKAVEVKANINMTAVKMMEANAKMLAATKAAVPTVQLNQQNIGVQGGTDTDLERILSEPMTSEDEY